MGNKLNFGSGFGKTDRLKSIVKRNSPCGFRTSSLVLYIVGFCGQQVYVWVSRCRPGYPSFISINVHESSSRPSVALSALFWPFLFLTGYLSLFSIYFVFPIFSLDRILFCSLSSVLFFDVKRWSTFIVSLFKKRKKDRSENRKENHSYFFSCSIFWRNFPIIYKWIRVTSVWEIRGVRQ